MSPTRRRIAIFSSFPPDICGIAQYAEAQARTFEAAGAKVDRVVLSPSSSHGLGVTSSHRTRDLPALVRDADEVWVHYQLSFFYNPRLRPLEVRHAEPHLLLASLLLLNRARSFVVVHERGVVVSPRRSRRFQRLAAVALFRAAGTLVFHTVVEEQAFARELFVPHASRIVPPNAFYGRRATVDRQAARARVGVDASALLFVCIGFFHEGKGFLPFANAFQRACDAGELPAHAQLAIVTSIRPAAGLEHDEAFARLRAGIAMLSRVRLVEGYVSDDEFDQWLVAADWAVAPYLAGFTSSIAARASVYGTPCLLADVGGLAEQATSRDLVYRGAADLPRALRDAARRAM